MSEQPGESPYNNIGLVASSKDPGIQTTESESRFEQQTQASSNPATDGSCDLKPKQRTEGGKKNVCGKYVMMSDLFLVIFLELIGPISIEVDHNQGKILIKESRSRHMRFLGCTVILRYFHQNHNVGTSNQSPALYH